MSYRVDWVRVEDALPPANLFDEVWVMTDAGIIRTQYAPDQKEVDNVDGFWVQGSHFERVTHWAYIIYPMPPDDFVIDEPDLSGN